MSTVFIILPRMRESKSALFGQGSFLLKKFKGAVCLMLTIQQTEQSEAQKGVHSPTGHHEPRPAVPRARRSAQQHHPHCIQMRPSLCLASEKPSPRAGRGCLTGWCLAGPGVTWGEAPGEEPELAQVKPDLAGRGGYYHAS